MIGCGIATTSALIVRVHCCIAVAAVAAVVAAVGVVTGVVAGVSGFTDSVSALGDSVAGLAVVSETGAGSVVAPVSAVEHSIPQQVCPLWWPAFVRWQSPPSAN